jgi:hypothetical protein
VPVLLKATKAVTDRLPKVISPGAHAVIDYAVAGMFFAGAALLWKQHRPAAVSALVCGLAETSVAVLTDYPGGVVKKISFPVHGRIDVGFTLLTAALPEFMKFEDVRESRFFDVLSIAMAGAAGLTDFTGSGETGQLSRIHEGAA